MNCMWTAKGGKLWTIMHWIYCIVGELQSLEMYRELHQNQCNECNATRGHWACSFQHFLLFFSKIKTVLQNRQIATRLPKCNQNAYVILIIFSPIILETLLYIFAVWTFGSIRKPAVCSFRKWWRSDQWRKSNSEHHQGFQRSFFIWVIVPQFATTWIDVQLATRGLI